MISILISNCPSVLLDFTCLKPFKSPSSVCLPNKTSQDEEILRNLGMKSGFKIRLMGSREEDIAKVCHAPKDLPDVINDFQTEEEKLDIENVKMCLFQIQFFL